MTRDRTQHEIVRAVRRIGWDLAREQQWGRETRLVFRPNQSRPQLAGTIFVTLRPKGAGTTKVAIEGRALTRRLAARASRLLAEELGRRPEGTRRKSPGTGAFERGVVRAATVVLVLAAVTAAIVMSAPTKCVRRDLTQHAGVCAPGKVAVPELPAFAFGQPVIYHIEIAVIVFFAGLLFITPAVSAISRGRLPTEISTSGVRFGNLAAADAGIRTAVRGLQERVASMDRGLDEVKLQLARHTPPDPPQTA